MVTRYKQTPKKIIAKLEEIPGIKIIKSKPRILQFIPPPVSDTYDLYDRDREGDFEKNSKNFENNADPTLSYRSDRSDSIDKLVKVSSKGPPIPMTNEQHDSIFGNNKEEEEGDSSN